MATIYSIKGIKTKKDEEILEKALEAEGITGSHADSGKGTLEVPEGISKSPKLKDIIENLGFIIR